MFTNLNIHFSTYLISQNKSSFFSKYERYLDIASQSQMMSNNIFDI